MTFNAGDRVGLRVKSGRTKPSCGVVVFRKNGDTAQVRWDHWHSFESREYKQTQLIS